jgi:hypothetical protein
MSHARVPACSSNSSARSTATLTSIDHTV